MANQYDPDIDGDLVVWSDQRPGDYGQIYGRRLSSGGDFRISGASAFPAATPAVAGDIVVWADQRNSGDSDIYGFIVTP